MVLMQATAQTQAPTPPPASDAPVPAATGAGQAAPSTPAPVITITDASGITQTLQVPQTRDELNALREHRSEVSSQLTSVAARRRELAEEIRSTPAGASRTGLEARISVLDQRIIQLETDLANTGRLVAAAPSELLSYTEQPSGGGDDFEEGLLAGGFTVLLAFPVIYYFLRRRWKKRNVQRDSSDMSSENARRLERLEQGMESIAIEIERVSEGQRFVTRLLSEAAPAPANRRVAEGAHLPTVEG